MPAVGCTQASNTANDVNNFSAFNGGILKGVTVLPDELRSFKDEKIIWLTVKNGYGVVTDWLLTALESYTQRIMYLVILHPIGAKQASIALLKAISGCINM